MSENMNPPIPSMPIAPEGASQRTVLVVDDMPDNLHLISNVLHGHYRVRVANSGAHALQILQTGPRPDLMLLDIMMPEMDGHEVIRRMRAQEQLREIPVIFVTALGAPADEELGFSLGAVDYIAKPVSPPTLLARVRNHIALNERTAALLAVSEKLSHYLPPQVCKSILEGTRDAAITTQRKQLTIFFSDIKDFTESAESMEPEDLTRLLNAYFSEMSAIATEYGATLNKFIGDGVLAFFGDPDTRGIREDALQCVRMSVAMQRRMRHLQARWRDEGFARPYRIRIGIHSGYCNVGNFGSDERMDYTVIGAAVNLASRLQEVGDPDGVMLSYETYALVRNEFAAQERPAVKVKGILREIECYALTGIHEEAQTPATPSVDNPGLQLQLNLAQMDAAAREQAAAELERALALLRQTP
jgi:adenylate cyclase